MKVLAFAEQREGKFKKVAFEVTQAASRVAKSLGAELVTVVLGNSVQGIAPTLGAYGATRVIVAEDPRLQLYSTTAYSTLLTAIAQKEQADVLLLPASQMGKDLAPHVAVRLNAGLAADCTALSVENGTLRATRPVYAGKALIDVTVTSPVKLFTLRPNVFTAAQEGTASAAVEQFPVALTEQDFAAKAVGVKVVEGRPDLTEASIIVSGGRGMKAPENFKLIEQLADVLGGAVGASRAVVDAGWRTHDEQVGQTGKTVSPSLYLAFGISGAVQHLAGMSSSKCIVAINKDKDAPIFQIADYGIVGDALEILPKLTEACKTAVGK